MTAVPVESAADVEGTFARVPLLGRLSRRQRAALARLATRRTFGEGATIVRQGDTAMTFYVILTGRVRVVRESEGGGQLERRELGPGGFFGEMGLIDDQPRSATVIALEPTECALLARWDFQNELREDPDIALALLPVLTERVRELEARLGPPGA